MLGTILTMTTDAVASAVSTTDTTRTIEATNLKVATDGEMTTDTMTADEGVAVGVEIVGTMATLQIGVIDVIEIETETATATGAVIDDTMTRIAVTETETGIGTGEMMTRARRRAASTSTIFSSRARNITRPSSR